MRKRSGSQQGWIALVMLITLLVICLATAGWIVWNKSRSEESKAQKSGQAQPKNEDTSGKTNIPKPDPYEGWQTYSNTTYGIHFRYPQNWNLAESAAAPAADSLTKAEYTITLKSDQQVKYDSTISMEVFAQPLSAAATVYNFSQTQNVTKTTETLKGKSSIQYVIPGPDEPTKLYLFGLGDKTLTFRSMNEWQARQSDPNYWNRFDKVLDSLTLD